MKAPAQHARAGEPSMVNNHEAGSDSTINVAPTFVRPQGPTSETHERAKRRSTFTIGIGRADPWVERRYAALVRRVRSTTSRIIMTTRSGSSNWIQCALFAAITWRLCDDRRASSRCLAIVFAD